MSAKEKRSAAGRGSGWCLPRSTMRGAALSAAVLCAAALCACNFSAPRSLLPPPFGPDPDRPEPARFFFPTGIVIDPSARWVVVSNSNADRQYDWGAMYSLRAADLLQFFEPGPAAGTVPFPTAALAGRAITGNYTGPIILAAGTAYTGSRDTNRLNAVALDDATGALSCLGAGGDDCRDGAIDLNSAAKLEGPFGIAAASVRPPGATADVGAVLVSSLIPHIDDVQSGLVLSTSRLAAVDQTDPTRVLFVATVTNRLNGSGVGGGPLVFDGRAREAIIAGCFTRFGNASPGGEASTLKCGLTAGGVNLLRFVPLDAGSSASARLYDLGPELHSVDTTGMALGAVDPATGTRRLYLTTRFPDAVVRVGLPADPALAPVVESISTISSQPSQIIVVQRPTGSVGPDLLAVTGVATYETSTAAGKLILLDAMAGRVVGQVDEIGDTPFAVVQFPPSPGDGSARLAVTAFGSCGISLIDVPYDRPSTAQLRARVGSCPR